MIDNAQQPIIVDARDPYRTPMQWDNTLSAGFSKNATTWTRVNENYRSVNVETQKQEPRSHYHTFSGLTALRNESTIIMGDLHTKVLSREVLAFTREYPGLPTYVVLANLGNKQYDIDLSISFFALPEHLTVVSMASSSPYAM